MTQPSQIMSPSLPILLDEGRACRIITEYSGIHTASLDDLRDALIPGISLFEKKEEKKHLSIEDIRLWIGRIGEIPYEEKHIYVLRDFDNATIEAMNASLKILEEPPPYAIILLTVSNPETLLETIRSRSINLFRKTSLHSSDSQLEALVRDFRSGRDLGLLNTLLENKWEREEYYSLLSVLALSADAHELDRIERAFIELFTTNESPRNIIDKVVIGIHP